MKWDINSQVGCLCNSMKFSKKPFQGAAILLANFLFAFAAHSQTVDPLIVNCTTEDVRFTGIPFINTVVPLPGGRTLIGGYFAKFTSGAGQYHTNIVLLNSDGSVNDGFQVGLYNPFNPYAGGVNCMALQTNGQILIGGDFEYVNGQPAFSVARLNADGTTDTNFNPAEINSAVRCMLVQKDGKIVVGGGFSFVNNNLCYGLCRLNFDGSQDTNFNAVANGSIYSLALQPDGKILAKGNFTSIGGQSITNLARLWPDGSIDTNFQIVSITLGGSTGYIGSNGPLSIQPDGKILVGGLFDMVNGLAHTNIVRLNPDGTVDTNFNAQADLSNSGGLQTLSLQADGKILVGHDSITLNGYPCPTFGRLNADGTFDFGFTNNLFVSFGYAGYYANSAAIQPDGRILVGGYFTSLGGLARNCFGRLINTGIATQSFSYGGGRILWLRGGTSPEVWRTSFETSTNGIDWTYLGDGTRVNGGWQLTNVSVSTNATIRARGFATGGIRNGSSWFVESLFALPLPAIVLNDGNLGFRTNLFGFNLSGKAGSTVVVDATSNLFDWSPIATNVLGGGLKYFNDPSSTNSLRKFYRVRLP